MEVSIQAVSPELGEHFSVTAFLGSGSLAQAGVGAGGVAGAAAGAAGAAAGAIGVWACDELIVATLRKRPSIIPRARVNSPAREDFINVMV
jgi:hypothetical protein